MKVSFDFDDTLDRSSVQEYAKELVHRGLEVWICTRRLSNEDAENPRWNDDLYQVAREVGIKKENIHFCGMLDKHTFFKDNDFVWHLDDDWIEIRMINERTKTIGISVFGNTTWKNKCNKKLGFPKG